MGGDSMSDRAEAMRTLLDAWGWALPRRDGAWTSVRCGNHDDRNASARVHMQEGAYACLACGLKAGSPVGLVMEVKQLTYPQAADYLRTLSIDPTTGEDVEVARSGPKRPWRGRRPRRGGSAAGWRASHAAGLA